FFFFILLLPPPTPTLFPYTTLFRSLSCEGRDSSDALRRGPAARRLSACATTDDSRGGSCPGLGVARSPHPPRLPRRSLRSLRVAGPRGTRGSRTPRSPVPPAARGRHC